MRSLNCGDFQQKRTIARDMVKQTDMNNRKPFSVSQKLCLNFIFIAKDVIFSNIICNSETVAFISGFYRLN